ncbi:hypothetical protein DYH09_13800 [bacterium CPR1]|nr:hypothetical protein [bacterium CPR1]
MPCGRTPSVDSLIVIEPVSDRLSGDDHNAHARLKSQHGRVVEGVALTLATAGQALGFKPVHLSITGNGPKRATFLYMTTTSDGQVREYPEQEVSAAV